MTKDEDIRNAARYGRQSGSLTAETAETFRQFWESRPDLSDRAGTAVLTTINEHRDTGWWDTITVYDLAGNEVESISVRPAEDDAPYEQALTRAGWRIVAAATVRSSAAGSDAWSVERI